MGIVFAAVVKRKQIRHGRSRQDTFIQRSEHIETCRIGGKKTLTLTQQDPVGTELGTGQFGGDFIAQRVKTVQILCSQVNENSAVDKRFAVAVHGRDQRSHILQVGFSGDALLHVVGVAALHAAFIGGVMDNGFFFSGSDLATVDAQGNTAFVAKVMQQRQFLGTGRVGTQGQSAAVCAAEDVMVGVELHGGGSNHVQKVLWSLNGQLFGCGFCFLLFLLFLSHPVSNSLRRRSYQNALW